MKRFHAKASERGCVVVTVVQDYGRTVDAFDISPDDAYDLARELMAAVHAVAPSERTQGHEFIPDLRNRAKPSTQPSAVPQLLRDMHDEGMALLYSGTYNDQRPEHLRTPGNDRPSHG